jgi:metal-dependent hydrolase (beta-lactamase superfamily II)
LKPKFFNIGFDLRKHLDKAGINSQAHIDHCGGFAEFKRQTGATVIASKLAAEQMIPRGRATTRIRERSLTATILVLAENPDVMVQTQTRQALGH